MIAKTIPPYLSSWWFLLLFTLGASALMLFDLKMKNGYGKTPSLEGKAMVWTQHGGKCLLVTETHKAKLSGHECMFFLNNYYSIYKEISVHFYFFSQTHVNDQQVKRL